MTDLSSGPPPRLPCLFCGMSDSKRSREHFLRSSLRQHLSSAPVLDFHEVFRGLASHRRVAVSQFDLVVRRICVRCNNSWLEELEDRAEAPLRYLTTGHGLVPSIDQLNHLAYWACGRALLRTYVSPEGRAPQSLFRQIYANRNLRSTPENFRVAIALTTSSGLEAGTHQSAVINGTYLGHVALFLDSLLVSVFFAENTPNGARLLDAASTERDNWLPKRLWRIGPPSYADRPGDPSALSAGESLAAAFALGFILGLDVRTPLGEPITLSPEIHPSRIGSIPWRPAGYGTVDL